MSDHESMNTRSETKSVLRLTKGKHSRRFGSTWVSYCDRLVDQEGRKLVDLRARAMSGRDHAMSAPRGRSLFSVSPYFPSNSRRNDDESASAHPPPSLYVTPLTQRGACAQAQWDPFRRGGPRAHRLDPLDSHLPPSCRLGRPLPNWHGIRSLA